VQVYDVGESGGDTNAVRAGRGLLAVTVVPGAQGRRSTELGREASKTVAVVRGAWSEGSRTNSTPSSVALDPGGFKEDKPDGFRPSTEYPLPLTTI
jgi:hypothetical protein